MPDIDRDDYYLRLAQQLHHAADQLAALVRVRIPAPEEDRVADLRAENEELRAQLARFVAP
jgi:hypothetical protein